MTIGAIHVLTLLAIGAGLQGLQGVESTSSTVKRTTYSSALTVGNPLFTRPGGSGQYYYELIQIVAKTTGQYVIRSSSAIDLFGLLYYPSFKAAQPTTDLVKSDDDSAGNKQFQITWRLTANRPYYLVVTTHSPRTIGSFSLSINGPAHVRATRVSKVHLVTSTIRGSLTSGDRRFTRYDGAAGSYYYRVFHLNVPRSADFIFTGNGGTPLAAYLYQDAFIPSSPSSNLVQFDEEGAGQTRCRFQANLSGGRNYYLVMTTAQPSDTGNFDTTVVGSNAVKTETADAPSNGQTSSSVASMWGTNSPQFRRPSTSTSNYYYRVILVTPSATSLQTLSYTSSVPAITYLYAGGFDPSQPDSNLIAHDDHSESGNTNGITLTLNSGTRYDLVITPTAPNTVGDFSVQDSGPDGASLSIE